MRPIVPKQIVREYIYAYGAVSPFDGDSCYLILPAMNADCMSYFLKELSDRFPDNYLLVVYDGAPCHQARSLIIPEDMMVTKLPPHSPELNPQENNWDDMREKFFKNTVFNSMTDVIETLSEACQFYEANPDIIQSMTGWNWITHYSIDF